MPSQAVDAKGLANQFLEWADHDRVSVSPMKLQKLIFFCHADFLVRNRKPLVKQEFEAWDYGPVIPSLYREFKGFKDRPITARALSFDPISTQTVIATCDLSDLDGPLVRKMFNFYSSVDALDLSHMSHEFEGAWRQARSLFANGLNMDRRISNEMIVSFHKPIHS